MVLLHCNINSSVKIVCKNQYQLKNLFHENNNKLLLSSFIPNIQALIHISAPDCHWHLITFNPKCSLLCPNMHSILFLCLCFFLNHCCSLSFAFHILQHLSLCFFYHLLCSLFLLGKVEISLSCGVLRLHQHRFYWLDALKEISQLLTGCLMLVFL